MDPEFWSQRTDTITEITFDYKFATPDLPGDNFVEVLKYTPKLKTLNLICSLHLFNKFIDALSAEDTKKVFENIKNVQKLQMYFSEVCVEMMEFKPWMDKMTNFKNIDFDVHSKKAYNQIYQFLTKYASKVKGLHICDNNKAIKKSVIERLLEIEHMKLKAFDLIINSASKKVFTELLCSQVELQYLTVNGTFSLSTALPKFLKLKEIAISNGPSLDGFKLFNNAKKLESLGIASREFYGEEDLDENYKLEKNPKLKDLQLIDATVDFTPQLMKRLCECFENIRLLNVDGAMMTMVTSLRATSSTECVMLNDY